MVPGPHGRSPRAAVEITRRTGKSKPCVWRWQQRFAEAGVDGLLRDKTRKPGKPRTPEAVVQRVVALTCAEPPGEATHWTGRMMSKATGLSLRTVQRIWTVHKLQPHRLRTFKRSSDPEFITKLLSLEDAGQGAAVFSRDLQVAPAQVARRVVRRSRRSSSGALAVAAMFVSWLGSSRMS